MNGPLPLPPAVLALVETLERDEPVDQQLLEAVARWRLACGDSRAAARWQRWSLQPPNPDSLRQALRQLLLWLNHADLSQRLGASEGWDAVALALEQHNPVLAMELQQRVLASAELPDPRQTLHLASHWQRQGQPEAALTLLELLAVRHPSPALCNAIAHQLDQLQRHAEAAPWWDRSLNRNPQQLPALIERGRNALLLNQPGLAVLLAQQVLERDPAHGIGQELELQALERLGARASMRQALAAQLRRQPANFHGQALRAWWAPRRRRQRAWRQSLPPELQSIPRLLLAPPRPLPVHALADCRCVGLFGSRDGLELLGAFRHAAPQGVLWDLGSREPLCSQRNLKQLLPPDWQLKSWHHWDPTIHDELETLVVARPADLPPQLAANQHPWQWSRNRRAWERQATPAAGTSEGHR